MMTDERLEFLRRAAHPDYTRGEFLDEAIAEIDRLRIENSERWEEIGEIYDAFEETGSIETRGRTKGVLAERDSMRAEIERLRAEIASHHCGESDNHNFRRRSMVDVLGRPT